MWDLPGPGLEPVSPALAGRFLTTAPPGKSHKPVAPGFPGGAVVKNLPANAGDTGSSPGPGRPHMPWNNLSPWATTTEPAL